MYAFPGLLVSQADLYERTHPHTKEGGREKEGRSIPCNWNVRTFQAQRTHKKTLGDKSKQLNLANKRNLVWLDHMNMRS